MANDEGPEGTWLRALLDLTPTPLLLIEPQTAKVLFANSAAHRMAGGTFPTGTAADEYHAVYHCTNAAGERIPNEEMPGVRAARGERLQGFEMDWHTSDRVRSLIVSSETVPPIHGHPATVVLSFEDITRVKRAESEERAARVRAERAEREAQFLAEASTALAGSLDYERTLATVARLAVPRLADWCVIDTLGHGGSFERVAVAHVDPEKERLGWEISRRYPTKSDAPAGMPNVVRTGEPELYPDVPDEAIQAAAHDAEHLRLLRELGFRSAMTVPLRARGRVLGAISFIAAESDRRFGEAELAFAGEVARRAAVAIDNARLYRERTHIAQTLQRSLLPPELPTIPGFEVAARYRPVGEGNEVGGDFYDLFPVGDEAWSIVVGDVRGKGADAAAVTALARYTLREVATREPRPSRVLAALNDAILRQRPGEEFCTAIYASLARNSGRNELRLSCGGHPPPVLLRENGEASFVGSPGTLIGALPSPSLGEQRLTLSAGDAIVFYTDGVAEARLPSGPAYLDIPAVLASHRGEDSESLAGRLYRAAEDLQEGRQHDDMAIVVLRAE